MMRYLLADPARLRRIGLGFGLVILVAVLTLVNQKPWTPESLSGLNPWVLRLGTALVLALMVMANIRALGFDPRQVKWLLMTHDRMESEEFLLTQEFLAMMLGVQRTGVTRAASALPTLLTLVKVKSIRNSFSRARGRFCDRCDSVRVSQCRKLIR